jgi:hypothetical protein
MAVKPDRWMLGQFWSTGYSEARMFSASLTQAAGDGASFSRPGGVLEMSVVATVSAIAGATVETVQLRLEGNLDGSNWHTISSHTVAASTLAANSTLVINSVTDSIIDVGRFANYRVRLIIGALAGLTITVAAQAVAIVRGGGVAGNNLTTLTRTAAAVSGTAFQRPEGSRYATVQVVTTNLNLGAASSILAALQGSPDGGTTWFNLATGSITANGSQLLASPEGVNLIDLAAFAYLRIRTTDVGGVSTAYTVNARVGTDTSDWLSASESLGGGGAAVDSTLVRSTVQSVGAEAGNAITVVFQLQQFDGTPVASARRVEAIIYDTTNAGNGDLSTNATITAVTQGTANSALGANRLVVTSTAAGVVGITVSDAAAETVFACLASPDDRRERAGHPDLRLILIARSVL